MSTTSTLPPLPPPASSPARPHPRGGAEGETQPSAAVLQKAARNAAILQATSATLGARDQPLALLLRTAIDRLNEQLEPELGPNAIQSTVDSGVDTSPEATAERIVSLSTAFYGAFQRQHPDEAEPLARFMDVIREGIDRGFSEAREILDGLQVLQGGIASNIDKTYELVQQGLSSFEQRLGGEAETDTG